MSSFKLIARTAALSTHTARKTLIQLLAPSDQKVKICQFGVAFAGVDPTGVPILIELARQTDAGTPGGDGGSLTLVKQNTLDTETPRTTAQKGTSTNAAWSVNPSFGDTVFGFAVHPQSSLIYGPPPEWQYVMTEGERLGLVVTAAAAISCYPFINFEE